METTLARPWIPTDEHFAARLALIRQHMGWNAKEASLECGISQNNWLHWETGASPRNYFDVCQKIAKRTGVDISWLMMGSQPQPSDYMELVTRPRRSRPANRSDVSGPRTK